MTDGSTDGVERRPLHKILYVQVIAAIVAGATLGTLFPEAGVAMKPLGDGFIKLIKMIIAPVILLTVSLGIAGMRDMKQLGRVGLKAVIYFEVVSTVALVIGLVVVNVLGPGRGF
ncbi:MAG: cation:dicarboxylase symporter family transporter, partial [Polyangiaceae bacterium]|nr:cation:dicarboxylase symporter family transporter [Polyangiaceae bacterium]